MLSSLTSVKMLGSFSPESQIIYFTDILLPTFTFAGCGVTAEVKAGDAIQNIIPKIFIFKSCVDNTEVETF